MKYLILSLFIVLSGCKSEKQKFYEETGIYLLDAPEFAELNDFHICNSHTKKIDNKTRVIACYNTALRKKIFLDNRIKLVKPHPELSTHTQLHEYLHYGTTVYDYLHYGIRTCFNTVFKNDSIKYFCNEFDKHYDNICKQKYYQNYCYNHNILMYKIKEN